MKTTGWLLFTGLGLLAPQAAFGQTPPPNDDFANRTVLTGSDVTFAGTLAGATIEDSEEVVAYQTYLGSATPTQSVWWTWTAPTNTALTLQIVSSSQDQSQVTPPDGLFIYYATNGSTKPDCLAQTPLGATGIFFRLAPQTISIPVAAGSNYDIQLIGGSSAGYTFRLVAADAPVIIQQPRSQTVYSNASALFYVVSAGTNQPDFAFQWQFNGTNLDGETAPMLALTNIDSSMAGAYSVIVSNNAGHAISEPAALAVSQSNALISLAVTGSSSDSLQFSLTGENGRNYRIESSADLVNWSAEPGFPKMPFWPDSTSIVFNSNSPTALSVTNNGTRKFFRATPYLPADPDAEICVNHLREIRVAKLLWQRDILETEVEAGWPNPGVSAPNEWPGYMDLSPYFPRRLAPFCPDDEFQSFPTSYNIQPLTNDPFCYIHPTTHALEDPQ